MKANSTDGERDTEGKTRPVLIMHGSYQNPTIILKDVEGKNTLPLQLYDEGFDVWLGGVRGTNDAVCQDGEDCGYDDLMNWATYGTVDFPAFVDSILERTEQQQLDVVGFSRGTSAAFYGLAKSEISFQKQINKAVMLAPCVYSPINNTLEEMQAWMKLRTDLGIMNTRPEQYAEHTALICVASKDASVDDDLAKKMAT